MCILHIFDPMAKNLDHKIISYSRPTFGKVYFLHKMAEALICYRIIDAYKIKG